MTLGHEFGAGAACLKCKDKCEGFELHFWRCVRPSVSLFFPIPGTPWAKTKRLSETGHKILVYGSVLQFWKPPFPLYSQKWGVQAPWTTQGCVSATIWALIWSSGWWNTAVSGQSSTLGCFSWRHWHHQVLQHKSTRHEVTLQHGWRCARNVTACRGGWTHWLESAGEMFCRRRLWVCPLSGLPHVLRGNA